MGAPVITVQFNSGNGWLAEKPAVSKAHVRLSSSAPAKSVAIAPEVILAVKKLVARLGARPLRTLIDPFAK
jgi:hypothetical protein